MDETAGAAGGGGPPGLVDAIPGWGGGAKGAIRGTIRGEKSWKRSHTDEP